MEVRCGMTRKTLFWLGPLVFLIHDLEEVFLARAWVEQNRSRIAGTAFEPVVEAMGYEPGKFGLVVALVPSCTGSSPGPPPERVSLD